MWTWVALDADSKLVVCWHLGLREVEDALALMNNLASRVNHRIQLRLTAHNAYLESVEDAFSNDIDCAMLVKLYGKDRETEARYSPRNLHRHKAADCRGVPEQAAYFHQLH